MNNIELEELKKYNMELGSCDDRDINAIKNKIEKTLKSASSILNLQKDELDKRDFGFDLTQTIHSVHIGVPNKIDYTGEMSPVKNQGGLGSCVGFAVAAMKEWQEQKEHDKEVAEGKRDHRKELDHYDLSEAWIYWNSKKIDPWPNSEGTSIRCAMRVLHKIGVPCEEGYAYSDKYKGEPTSWSKLIAKWGLIDSYWRCKDINDLRVALVNGPVVIGVGCFREIFFVGKNGIVPYPANPNEMLGGHAICAVGYDDTRGLIKFKNSWGSSWGKNGYGYLPYKYIKNFMWDSWIAKDLSVTKKMIKERGKDEL